MYSAAGKSRFQHFLAYLRPESFSGWTSRSQPSTRSSSTATVTSGNIFLIWSGSSPNISALPAAITCWKPVLSRL